MFLEMAKAMGRPKSFNQSDVTRAIMATRAAGLTIDRVIIENGTIALFPGPPESENGRTGNDKNEWDDLK